MFISKRNHLVYPQSEHLKLASGVAKHWGNDDFDKPPVPFESFVKAVENHDSGYGHYDTAMVGQQTEEEIEKLWRRCTDQKITDIYAQIIIKRHFMRLCGLYANFPRLAAFQQSLSKEVETLYKQNELDPHIFDVTDTIMNLCDAIAFSFCREELAGREVKVYASAAGKPIPISYTIDQNHTIYIDPYPLDEALISGSITAYDSKDYPKVLLPNEINYQIMKKS